MLRAYAPLLAGLALVAAVVAPFVVWAQFGQTQRDPEDVREPSSREARVGTAAETGTGAGTVLGTVTDAAGEPVAGVRVDVVSPPYEAWIHHHRVTTDAQAGETWSAVTDEEGSYHLPGVTAGPHRVVFAHGQDEWATLWHPAGARADLGEDVLVEDGSDSRVGATVVEPATVSGRVATATRQAYVVTLQRRSSRYVWDEVRRVRGGRDAGFRFGHLPPGRYRVAVHAHTTGTVYGPGTSRERRAAVTRLAAGDEVRGLGVRVPRPAQVSGTVRSSSGQPVANHPVELRTSGMVGARGSTPGRLVRVRTDAEGRYRASLPPETWSVSPFRNCTDGGVSTVRAELRTRHRRDLTYDPPETLTGRLVGRDGRALARRSVNVWPVGGTRGCGVATQTGPDGRWRVRGLQPGRHRVGYDVPRRRPTVVQVGPGGS